MIDCEERARLKHELTIAMVAALKARTATNTSMIPSNKLEHQLECAEIAEEREKKAREAYTQHFRTHRCLG